MAEIHETLEKLVAVAKKKGYIDPECTVQSLKEEAAHKKSEDEQGDSVGLMTAMKKSLDTQTQAVRLVFSPLAFMPMSYIHCNLHSVLPLLYMLSYWGQGAMQPCSQSLAVTDTVLISLMKLPSR